MAIIFSCECGKKLRVADELAGKLAGCPTCKKKIRVPAADAIQAEEPPVVQPAPVVKPPPLVKPAPVSAWDEKEEEDEEEEREDIETQYFGPEYGGQVFFRDAPKKIGELHSAHTSLRKNVTVRTTSFKLILSALITGPILFIIFVAAIAMQFLVANPMSWFLLAGGFLFLCFVIGVAVLAIVFASTSYEHFCGYVGTKGAALFHCSGQPSNVTKHDVMLFDEADELRIATTHHLVNDSYTHTDFSYIWVDRHGRTLLNVTGTHHSYNETPPLQDLFHFGEVAERVWSVHLLAKVLPKLKDGGKHKFRLSGDNYLLLREDSLVLHLNGESQDFEPEDIAEMRIENGMITLKEPGAKKGWFTESGFHHFSFAELSNARVFLLLMEELFDVPING